jgi:protein FAM32A
MPSDEYAPIVRGALKLKGSTPTGVTKKKKKKKEKAGEEEKKSAIQKALEEEDASTSREIMKSESTGEDGEEGERELEERGNDGKTASERAYEEMRRKRVWNFCLVVLMGRGLEGEQG